MHQHFNAFVVNCGLKEEIHVICLVTHFLP